MKESIITAVAELDEKRVYDLVEQAIENEMDKEEILNCFSKGMSIIGDYYANGVYFAGDLVMAGMIFKTVLDMVGVYQNQNENDNFKGKIIVLTPQGDLHDIGKDIFCGFMIAEDYKIIDLGIDVTADELIDSVYRDRPDIIGISVTLSNSYIVAKNMIEELKKAGLRDQIKVIMGGSAVADEICAYCKVDAYAEDVAKGMIICSEWIKEKYDR